jgi:hypothetical protein
MALFVVTFEAEVVVQVDARSEGEAEENARITDDF